TGGASVATPITKEYKLKWHISQI
ncbi:hypothetical protein JCM11251_000618, partial [Rhodosporidiobolus azoricus]